MRTKTLNYNRKKIMKTVIQELIDDLIKGNVKPDGYYIEKEKQQILNSHYDAAIQIIKIKFTDKVELCIDDFEDAEQYYNETFN